MPTNTKQGIFLKLNYNSQMHSEIIFHARHKALEYLYGKSNFRDLKRN
ncbi:hypothetical protein SAMN04487930_10478 [Cytophaga hutchinsonii ATCC 33406]|nr:hypothetical protein SAMN04487930_10478 [Cytophaga hutchinsonii ATCC 33406]